jgi:hypothetical protein
MYFFVWEQARWTHQEIDNGPCGGRIRTLTAALQSCTPPLSQFVSFSACIIILCPEDASISPSNIMCFTR